ncbi:MAG: hypothetical protein JW983_09120 [Elusimicrobia bacterium]|nr:hypothetical protein [Elusimicrobiota bacterium]
MIKKFSLLIVIILAFNSIASGLGISTEFNNIFIENLQIGGEYNIREIANLPLKVQNTGEEKVRIDIHPVVPQKEHLREGFEVIPSTEWIRLSKERFEVGPEEYAISDVIISIPDDEIYLGKKYQVNLWSCVSRIGAGAGMVSVTPGIEGSLLFSIAPVKTKEKIKPVDLSFEVEPEELYAVADSTCELIGIIEIKNISKRSRKYEISQEDINKANIRIKDGYEAAPEGMILSFVPAELKIRRRKKKSFNVYIEMPDREKYIDKKYMTLMEIKTAGKGISGRKFIKTYIEIREQESEKVRKK